MAPEPDPIVSQLFGASAVSFYGGAVARAGRARTPNRDYYYY